LVSIMINGEPVSSEQASISVLDHGFLYGDNVYEVVKTRDGKLFAALPHLSRLRYSAEKVEIPVLWSDAFLLSELEETVRLVGTPEVYLRMVITRGIGDMGLSPVACKDPCRIIVGKELQPLSPDLYRDGVSICTLEPEIDERGNIKSPVNLGNIRAVKEARRRGCHEALRLNGDAQVAECATSNIFWVRKGELFTPSLGAGILKGVTRQLAIHLAEKARFSVHRGLFHLAELIEAEEVFLTSTTRDILPVSCLDEHRYPIGPITQTLMSAFSQIGDLDLDLF